MKTTTKISGFAIKNKRMLKIFLFFLVLTSIIWLLIELSKSYTSTIAFAVEYKKVPTNKLLQSIPISTLNMVVKAPGFTLLKYKAVKHKITFNLNNLTKNKKSYFIVPNKQVSFLNNQLSNKTEIISVLKDTIFIELGNNISKKIPVVSAIAMQFKLGYNLVEKLKFLPDSVTVTGPKKYIDSIQEVKTTFLKLENVSQNLNLELKLQPPSNSANVILSANKVKITGIVSKFTEGIFTIPVAIINKPKGIKVTPFPNEIEVVYQSSLINFNKISTNSFSVVFDYNQYKNDTLIQHLTPIIKQKSAYISSIKIIPNQIKFLIQK